MLEDFGHDHHRVMFYHFLKPCCDLDNGLEPLASDKDVVFLAKYVTEGLKLIEVYVEYEKTNPHIYILEIEELDDVELRTSRGWITLVANKLVLDVNESQSSGKDKGQSSVPSQFVNDFYSSYDPYVESQDLNFDLFVNLDLILPIINNKEGNARQNVEVKDEIEVEHLIEGEGKIENVETDVKLEEKNGDDTDGDC
nr:transposase, mutator type [Tanacetum cinerariifolium]